MKKSLLLIVIAFALSFGFLTIVNPSGNDVNANAASGGSSEEEVTLTGSSRGFGGDVTVTLVVKGDDIVSVEVDGPDETAGIGTIAIERLPEIIVEADSVEVDSVSGATFTSDAIKEAVKVALESR